MTSKDTPAWTAINHKTFAVVFENMSGDIIYDNIVAPSKSAAVTHLKRRKDLRMVISVRKALPEKKA